MHAFSISILHTFITTSKQKNRNIEEFGMTTLYAGNYFGLRAIRDLWRNWHQFKHNRLKQTEETRNRQLIWQIDFRGRSLEEKAKFFFKGVRKTTYRKFRGHWIKAHMNRMFKLRWVRNLWLFLRIYNTVACYHISYSTP